MTVDRPASGPEASVDAHWCTMVMSVILDGSLMHPRCRWIIAMAA